MSNRHGPEVVVFVDPAKQKRKKIIHSRGADQSTEEPDTSQLSMKRARYDVKRLGIAGLGTDEKEAATQALLIKLGAKPPRRKYYNYKEYMELKKKEKLTASSDGNMNDKKSKSKRKDTKRKRDRDDVCYSDGQIGRYRGGVQMLRKQDMDNVKSAASSSKHKR